MLSTTNTTLIRVDLEKHMDRRYSVAVQPTLLDAVAVVCVWGSRRSSYQRVRTLPADSIPEAEALAAKLVARKCRRGYRIA
jgi:predicted DNA-binding WGR domain protein